MHPKTQHLCGEMEPTFTRSAGSGNQTCPSFKIESQLLIFLSEFGNYTHSVTNVTHCTETLH